MFTGIIKGIGEVESYDKNSFVLRIACPQFKNCKTLGASIAIDGVCLTASYLDPVSTHIIGFDLGTETRTRSLLPNLSHSSLVNVEFALAMGDPLDGHLVQGHVDGIAEIVAIKDVENGRMISLKCSPSLMPLIVPKGSIAVHGVSLTVNEVSEDSFTVCLVPHTVLNTSFKVFRAGDLVHLETDIIGRYLHNFYRRLNATHFVRTQTT